MESKCRNFPYLVLMQTSKDVQGTYKIGNERKQTIQQIGNSILISSGSMTYVIDKLEQRELLRLKCMS